MSQRYRKATKMAEEQARPADENPPQKSNMRPIAVLYATENQQEFAWWINPAIQAYTWAAASLQFTHMITDWLAPKKPQQPQVEAAPGAMVGYLNKRIMKH